MAKTTSMLDKASAKVQKHEGGQIIDLASLAPSTEYVDVIPTNIEALDWELFRLGGVPRGGHLTTIYGKPDAGKSTLVKWLIAGAQQAYPDECVVVIDTENRVANPADIPWLHAAGIDLNPDKLKLCHSRSLPWIIRTIATFARSSSVSMIAIDTITNCYTVDEDGAEDGVGKTPGSVALLLSQSMPYILSQCEANNIALVIVAQVRSTMSEQMRGYYRGLDIKPGWPNQILHDSTIRLRIAHTGFVPSPAEREGWKMKLYVERGKNYAFGGATQELLVSLENGMPDFTTLLLETAVKMGIVLVAGGGWHTWTRVHTDGTPIQEREEIRVQGAKAFKAYLVEHNLVDALREAVKERLK